MFELKTKIEGKTMTVSLCGEIDHHTAKEIREKADAAIISAKPESIALDLSEISFMDSSGLGLIMGRYALMKDLSGSLSLRAPTAAVMKILTLAGMERIVKIEKPTKEKNHEEK